MGLDSILLSTPLTRPLINTMYIKDNYMNLFKSLLGVSLEFCSGKFWSGETKISLKILVPGTFFFENFVPLLHPDASFLCYSSSTSCSAFIFASNG